MIDELTIHNSRIEEFKLKLQCYQKMEQRTTGKPARGSGSQEVRCATDQTLDVYKAVDELNRNWTRLGGVKSMNQPDECLRRS